MGVNIFIRSHRSLVLLSCQDWTFSWGEKENSDALHPMDNLALSWLLGCPHLNGIGILRGIDSAQGCAEEVQSARSWLIDMKRIPSSTWWNKTWSTECRQIGFLLS